MVCQDAAENVPVESAGALSALDASDDVGVCETVSQGAAEAAADACRSGADGGHNRPIQTAHYYCITLVDGSVN